MLIDKRIGHIAEEEGIDGSLFQKELLTLDGMGKKSIQCWLNTPGGNVVQGYMIYSSILKSNTPVDTYNIGMVASMGFPIFMAGRKRIMMDYAIAMIHNPYKLDGSEPDDMTDAMAESMVKMIASRSKISENKVRKMMDEETWMTADECLKYGFATEIERSSSVNKKWMPAEESSVLAVWEQAKKVAANALDKNSNNSKTTNMTFRKVTAKLKLNEEASEESVVEAITGIETQAYNAETKIIQLVDAHDKAIKSEKETARLAGVEAAKLLEGVQAELATTKTSLAAKQAEYDTVHAQFNAMKAEKDAAIVAEKKTKAESLVTAHVKSGRIKNDVKLIDKYVALAINDLDGTKEIIEAIPLNKEAVVIDKVITIDAAAEKVMGSAEFRMLQIAAKHKQKV